MKHFYKLFISFLFILHSSAVWAFSSTTLVTSAKSQIGKTLYYDPAYTKLQYPMGDVPLIKGVCTDVVVRALRGQGIDLQQLIHEDMKKNFKAYPQNGD